jgi:tripartite-type tricarboxylate transporter receptor subunit TctC
MFDGIATMNPLIRAGRVRAIATTGTSRSTLLPELPTVAEALPGYAQIGFNGLLAPTGTPRHIVERLNGAVNRILETPAITAAFAQLGAESAAMSPASFGELLRDDIEKRRDWIRIAGIRPE